jgi:hypothetical protein
MSHFQSLLGGSGSEARDPRKDGTVAVTRYNHLGLPTSVSTENPKTGEQQPAWQNGKPVSMPYPQSSSPSYDPTLFDKGVVALYKGARSMFNRLFMPSRGTRTAKPSAPASHL